METPKDPRYKQGYHLTDPWAKDIRVREAMSISIDRKAIAKGLYLGIANPTPVGILLPNWEALPPFHTIRKGQETARRGGLSERI